MDTYKKIRKKLESLSEAEQFLQEYYHACQNPITQMQFLKNGGNQTFLSYFPLRLKNQKGIEGGLETITDTSVYEMNECLVYKEEKLNHDILINKHPCYLPKFFHKHDFFELLFVLKGEFCHEIDGQRETIQEGNLVFIAPENVHALSVFDESVVMTIYIRRSTFELAFFNLLRKENVLSLFFLESLYSRKKISHLIMDTDKDQEIKQSIIEMYAEASTNDYYSDQILLSMFNLLIFKLARNYGQNIRIPSSGKESDSKIDEILQYIYENYQTVSLNSTAEHFHYSPAYCSRLIRSHTDTTFSSIVKNAKLGTAQSILKNTKMTVEELALHIGYESKQAFIKAFQKETGMTPAAYRNARNCH